MSTTIDQRVVEMRFDNRHFEQNVSNTMSTLEKLKQKLNFSGASKGLDGLNTAAKNVNMAGLGASVEQVSAKFSALQVMGVTALANITNSAVNAGKRIASALTIEPIRSGFQEYETQINAVQTIQANTGAELPKINAALDELNKYADQTIYNFTEMTRNIGTFTAAGVDLDTSTSAIKGIANLAAVSGSTSQQASTAMYQLSQALAAGRVSLMDWNSVVNAGMGGKVFQNALIRTSEVMGTGAQAAIDKYGSFRESLTKGEWLTTDVLTETLKQFTMAAKEGSDEWNAFKKSLMESGYTEQQAEEILKMANTATDAATKVKTFTQLWDVLKESAQSGWSQTWKLIVGDFEEARDLLSPLAETLTGFINRMSDFRNRILEVALNFSKPWDAISEKLGKVKKVAENVEKVTDKLEYFQDVVNKVWRGDFNNQGDNPDRRDLLKAAGYDPRVVQDLVNKGYQYKLTVEDIEASHKKFGLTVETTKEETEEAAKSFTKLTDEQLKSSGLTEDEIALYRALEKEADRLGISVSKLADDMSKTDGRSLLVDSFKNIGDVFAGVGKAAKEAWIEIFNPPGAEVLGIRLYGLLESLKQLTERFRLTDKETGKLNENGEKIARTLKGVFAIIDVITTVIGGGFKIALKIINELLSRFDLNILDITAKAGDALVAFRDWFDSILNISGIVDVLVPLVQKAAKFIGNLIKSVKNSKWFGEFCGYLDDAADGLRDLFVNIPDTTEFQNLVSVLKKCAGAVRDWVTTLKSSNNIPRDIIAGLVKGIANGIPDILAAVFNLAKSIISGICDVLGIHSPARTMIAIGGFIIAGLILGLTGGEGGLFDAVEGVAGGIFEKLKTAIGGVVGWLRDLDLGAIFAAALSIGSIIALVKIGQALSSFGAAFEGFGELLQSASVAVDNFSKVLKAQAFKTRMEGVKVLAESILILVGALAILTLVDPKKLLAATGMIVVLALVIVGLAWAMNKIGGATVSIDWKKGLNTKVLTSGLMSIGLAILLIAMSVKALGSLEEDQVTQGINALLKILGMLAGLFVVISVFSRIGKTDDVNKVGVLMVKIGIALMLMVGVLKLMGKLTPDEITNGIDLLKKFLMFMGALALISRIGGKGIDGVGKMMLGISLSLLLIIAVLKLSGKLTEDDITRATDLIIGFTAFIAILAAIGALGGKGIDGVGKMMLGISISMLAMIAVMKLVATMEPGEMMKGFAAIVVFTGIITYLVKTLGKVGAELPKVALTLIAFSVAIGILAIVAAALGLVNFWDLAKGVAIVGALSLIMRGMITATRGATDITGTVIAMTVAIAVMVAAVALLTLIDPTKLAIAAAVLSVLMFMFSVMTKATSTVGKATGTVIAMAIAITAIGSVLILLSKLPAQSVIVSAVALSVLMGVMTGILYALVGIGTLARQAALGVAILAAMAIPLLAFVGVLALMRNITNAADNAIALSVLVAALSFALIPLAVVGSTALAALIGIGLLVVFIGALIELVARIGKLMSEKPHLKDFVDNGIDMLKKLANGLGAIIGSFITGFTGEVVNILPQLGTALSQFMDNAMPFIDGAKTIDEDVLIGAGILTAAILALSVADFISAIFTLGGVGLVGMGASLSGFMSAASGFFDGVKDIDPNSLTAVKTLAEAILIITAANVIDGLASLFGGGNSLDTFSTQLPKLGTGLRDFLDSVGTLADDETATIECAAKAVKTLASAASEIPNAGGLLADLVGDNELGTFAAQFPMLGTGLREFLVNIGTFTDEQLAVIGSAAEAVKTLAAASSEIPNAGGLLADLVGDNELGTFAKQFPTLGTGLRDFLENIGTFTDEQVAVVASAAEAVKTLASVANEIPNTGGLLADLVGDNSLGTFADQFPILGTGLRGFLDNVGTFGDDQLEPITAAATAVRRLAEASEDIEGQANWSKTLFGDDSIGAFSDNFAALGANLRLFVDNLGTFTEGQVTTIEYAVKAIKTLANLDSSEMSGINGVIGSFGDNIAAFGTDLFDFCYEMPASSTIDSAVTGLKTILSAIDDVSEANSGSLSELASNLKKVGGDAVDKFIGAFTSTTAKSDVKQAADDLADEAVDGLDNLGSDANYAGIHFGEGLIKGIDSMKESAYWAGYALGQKAVQGEKDGQQSKSPSKLTMQSGKWFGEGLVIGIQKMGGKVYSAGHDLGETAVKSLSSTVSRIATAIDSDIDVQPTIRPVLDLSDVRSGAGAIGDMLGVGSSVGVLANVGSISRAMNSRIQNVSNADVVDAINKLDKHLDNVGNTSYTISGITYDDGSSIATAVKDLTRYARMERRV